MPKFKDKVNDLVKSSNNALGTKKRRSESATASFKPMYSRAGIRKWSNDDRIQMEFTRIQDGLENKLIPSIVKDKPKVPDWLSQVPAIFFFFGDTGKGKTNACLVLVEAYIKEGAFTHVFIISPTYDQNKAFDVLGVPPERVWKGPQALHNSVQCFLAADKAVEQLAIDYAKYEEWRDAHARYTKYFYTGYPKDFPHAQKMRDENIVHKHDYKPPPFMPRPRPAMIIDDLASNAIYDRNSPLLYHVLTYRHIYGIGLSLFLLVQNYKGIEKKIRQNVKQFLLWHTHDSTQLAAVGEEISAGVPVQQFYEMFERATNKNYNNGEGWHFLKIDMETQNEALMFTRDFDTTIRMKTIKGGEESDDEETISRKA